MLSKRAITLVAQQVVDVKVFGGIPMITKKDRRHSGYVAPNPTISKKDLIKFDLFINPL